MPPMSPAASPPPSAPASPPASTPASIAASSAASSAASPPSGPTSGSPASELPVLEDRHWLETQTKPERQSPSASQRLLSSGASVQAAHPVNTATKSGDRG